LSLTIIMTLHRIYLSTALSLVLLNTGCTLTTKTYKDYGPDVITAAMFVRSIQSIQTRQFEESGKYLTCAEIVPQASSKLPLAKHKVKIEMQLRGSRGDGSPEILIFTPRRHFCVDCRGEACSDRSVPPLLD